MSTQPIDPAAVVAEHQPLDPESPTPHCSACGTDFWWPCEPYRLAAALEKMTELHRLRLHGEQQASAHVVRLAAELAAERAKVADAYDEGWVARAERGRPPVGGGVSRAPEPPPRLNPYRAALAGEGAAEQPEEATR